MAGAQGWLDIMASWATANANPALSWSAPRPALRELPPEEPSRPERPRAFPPPPAPRFVPPAPAPANPSHRPIAPIRRIPSADPRRPGQSQGSLL
ncbi:hypothetical protein MEX01_50200 [Methylorubrum extorquens]|nr:hypothetical protein MEX01_50200 [Methylorubrum extorquens]